jgi:signal transduction histidine kinase
MLKQHNNQQSDALNWSAKINYLALILTLLAVVFSCFSYFSMQALQKTSENRYHSYLLTEQLRLSSDQLTQMARAHVVTGEQKYLVFFNKILAIRNGDAPRPVNYHRVYWDMLIPENGQAPFIDGAQHPLQQLMAQAGFTQQEFEQLKKSQQASDKLTDLEFLAFNQVATALSEQTDYSQSAMKNSALTLLYSEGYLMAKSEIMSHINTFYRLQEERTDAEVQRAAQTHNLMTIVTLITFIALLIVLVFNFRLKQKLTLQFITMLKEEVGLQTKKIQEQNIQLTNTMEIMESTKVQLVESEKMASLGSLVAGVAHEINTPIGIGITAITSLQEEVKKLGQCIENNRLSKNVLVDYLDLFEKISDLVLVNLSRVGTLVKSFKQVSVDQSYDEIRNLELNEYVQAVVNSIRPNYKHSDIKIDVDIDSSIICDVYPGALSQVISNLVINAFVHAFDKEKKGEIIISATQQGDLVALNIRDNGQGMSVQDRVKAFEPFFTTKRNKGGTGLGLHIVYNLVTQKLLGDIRCESEQGTGSEFKITFPLQGKELAL